jgi:hypothetical protein
MPPTIAFIFDELVLWFPIALSICFCSLLGVLCRLDGLHGTMSVILRILASAGESAVENHRNHEWIGAKLKSDAQLAGAHPGFSIYYHSPWMGYWSVEELRWWSPFIIYSGVRSRVRCLAQGHLETWLLARFVTVTQQVAIWRERSAIFFTILYLCLTNYMWKPQLHMAYTCRKDFW